MTEANLIPPPAFTEAYAKARKAFGMYSAILLAWGLVGIQFESKPITSLNVKLLSPQAIPYALVALVIYFGFRFSIEWHQTDLARRKFRASQVDFWVAHTIGFFSIVLYAVQTALRFQIADKPDNLTPILFGFLLIKCFPLFKDSLSFGKPGRVRRYMVVPVLLVSSLSIFMVGTGLGLGMVPDLNYHLTRIYRCAFFIASAIATFSLDRIVAFVRDERLKKKYL